MSDAIRLIVVEDTPISLAVGEADPIARREIAELQEDVTTLQEDVADIEEQLDGFALGDGTYPALTSGAALSLTSPTAAESTWAQRVTDAVDGVAVVDGILGNTVVWNQAVRGYSTEYWTKTNAAAISSDDTAKTLTLTSSSDSSAAKFARDTNALLPSGHTYLIRANVNASNCTTNASLQIIDGSNTALLQASMTAGQSGVASVIGTTSGDGYPCVRFASNTPSGDYAVFSNMQIYDLTSMFGAGNEPSTVAEFERMFPEPYYPYDAGSLLSVNLTGVESADAGGNVLQQRTIPAATYFPNGMRSAGTVHDELTSDAAIVRIGERAYQSGDESDTSVVTDGTTTYYALATPTTQPISPVLNLTYRIERGGTESVIHTDPTAAPTWRTRYPLDLAAAVMANIAPVENGTASANYAIGDLLCVGWQLYRATSAIAIGERITAGTNVTATTVAAEIAAIQ